MSGGVDSTACSIILKESCNVAGFFMNLNQPNFDEQKERVSSIAAQLNINLSIIDLRQEFETHVLTYFRDSYFEGETPNPCVICNQEIKFGLFLNAIIGRGLEKMATGHYAKTSFLDGHYHLYQGKDDRKDQSYFLSRLNQSQLARIHFPLGNMTKDSVYKLVENNGFNDFRGRESQDVCFLENNNVNGFLQERQQLPAEEGPIISTSGKLLGTHKGIYRYTIGQRRGLGISSSTPLYVVRLDTDRNAVIVGKDDELFSKYLRVEKLHWLNNLSPDPDQTYQVRIRYTHKGAQANIEVDGDRGRIVFAEPQRAITPGQFAAIYLEEELLGSGVIM